ncbi:MAG: DUF456 domain-containing protein [Saprospiraceae bacterium]
MALDILLAIAAVACLIIGLIGSVLPLPGPPLSLLGIFLLHWSRFADFSTTLLWYLGLATVVVTVLDYLVPLWGVKRFGGSQGGVWGSTIGLLVGMFIGPLGVFAGAFMGALVGELIMGKNTAMATKAAVGSFVGFLFGVGLKVALCSVMIWYAGKALLS